MSKSTQQAGTKALRSGRYSAKNRIYHITTRTYAREPLFDNFAIGRLVVKQISHEEKTGHIKTLAFVLMPDHLHWLVQLMTDRAMSVAVNNVKSFSARRINQRRNQTGQVWQKGFYDRALRREEDVVEVARYIIANPLRAGLVRQIGDYPLWDAIWV
ncbi:MAG: transposase [Gammaproteobacteria bacterium]|nr:MAG: transposase [Gammaproteobacteria bacterium]RLA28866.1 MAG: transposase [Gammaproteobacteria bacterium]